MLKIFSKISISLAIFNPPSVENAIPPRSIKTINNFSILAEAEYWIRRELKIKTGWKDSDPFVKQFDQLVRRRFS